MLVEWWNVVRQKCNGQASYLINGVYVAGPLTVSFGIGTTGSSEQSNDCEEGDEGHRQQFIDEMHEMQVTCFWEF